MPGTVGTPANESAANEFPVNESGDVAGPDYSAAVADDHAANNAAANSYAVIAAANYYAANESAAIADDLAVIADDLAVIAAADESAAD